MGANLSALGKTRAIVASPGDICWRPLSCGAENEFGQILYLSSGSLVFDSPHSTMMDMAMIWVPSDLQTQLAQRTNVQTSGPFARAVDVVQGGQPIGNNPGLNIDRHPTPGRLRKGSTRQPFPAVAIRDHFVRHNVPDQVVAIVDLTVIMRNDLASRITFRGLAYDRHMGALIPSPPPKSTRPSLENRS